MSIRALYLGWAMALVAQPALCREFLCPPLDVGVQELHESGSKIIISTAKAEPSADEEGSYAIAEAEARLEARRQLMIHLSPQLNRLQRSGLIDIALCRANGVVYATLELDERNIARAALLQKNISDSLNENSTPK